MTQTVAPQLGDAVHDHFKIERMTRLHDDPWLTVYAVSRHGNIAVGHIMPDDLGGWELRPNARYFKRGEEAAARACYRAWIAR